MHVLTKNMIEEHGVTEFHCHCCERKLVVFGHDHYLLILDGWGHPDAPNGYERVESSTPGVTVHRSRHLMVSGPWCQEANEVLNPYLFHTKAVVADYRAVTGY